MISIPEEDREAIRRIREKVPDLIRLLAEKKDDKTTFGMDCLLTDPMVILAPQDKGEPPSWVPAWHGETIFWVDRRLFNQLKENRTKKPCKICPEEISKKCQVR